MINFRIFDRLFTVELRNGVGFDLEFVDSRPVWCFNNITEKQTAMPFMGVIILLPLLILSFGNVYKEIDE
jgi:hypothetical protein